MMARKKAAASAAARCWNAAPARRKTVTHGGNAERGRSEPHRRLGKPQYHDEGYGPIDVDRELELTERLEQHRPRFSMFVHAVLEDGVGVVADRGLIGEEAGRVFADTDDPDKGRKQKDAAQANENQRLLWVRPQAEKCCCPPAVCLRASPAPSVWRSLAGRAPSRPAYHVPRTVKELSRRDQGAPTRDAEAVMYRVQRVASGTGGVQANLLSASSALAGLWGHDGGCYHPIVLSFSICSDIDTEHSEVRH